MKIDIITFHNTSNFGATLQCCALSYYLSDLGHEVEIINYLPKYVLKKKSIFKEYRSTQGLKKKLKMFVIGSAYAIHASQIMEKDRKFERFISDNVKLTKAYYNEKSLLNDPPVADLYICGSDQIWNPTLTGGRFDNAYFLRFAQGRKASYGVSVGELNVGEENDQLASLTESFENISVREDTAAQELSKALRRTVNVVIDCTLLLCKKDYFKMEADFSFTDRPYLLLYNIQQSPTSIQIAKREAENRGIDIIDISPNPLNKVAGAKHFVNIGPAEFLKLIKEASFVVTNSFHGTVFSIIYEKQFITVPHSSRSQRVVDLLTALDLRSRIAYEYGYNVKDEISYERVRTILDELRKQSYDYIDNMILGNKCIVAQSQKNEINKNNKTIKLDSQRFLCCGCGACSNICPTGAISMIPDEEGFIYPNIDNGLCVDCNMCAEVCVFKAELQSYL